VIWPRLILERLQPDTSNLLVVFDPDGLVLDEEILSALDAMGFGVLAFEDPITFRYAYEANYRSRWDCREDAPLIVVVQDRKGERLPLPYDVWHAGRKISLSLTDIFPKLSYPVVAALEKSELDKLYLAYRRYDGPVLNERETKEYILQHVFGIIPGMINSPVELLKMLLSRHCNLVTLPNILDGHLVYSLRKRRVFRDWPLETIIPDREAFFAFLQEKWHCFLESAARGEDFAEAPFEHYDIRVYIDNLFLEGYLRPVPVASTEGLPPWALPGVLVDRQAEEWRRLERLLERVSQELPGETASHRDWQRLALLWAELLVISQEQHPDGGSEIKPKIGVLHDQLEECFAGWMLARYGSLANLAYTSRPVMVHHIPRYLAYIRSKQVTRRIALVVIDALALDQWLIIRDVLRDKRPGWRLEENQVFAWVPTLTSVSRQALFSGNPPFYFRDSLTTTSNEPQHWRNFWEGRGIRQESIFYLKGLGEGSVDDIASFADSGYEIVGLVIDKVDKIAHGMELGTAGMHQQVKLWAEQGYLVDLIDRLLKGGFDVYVTSDHGNIAARGQGRVSDGVLAESRGSRARIYQSEVFRKQMMEQRQHAISWPGFGLPQGYYVMLAKGRSAFANEGEQVISHGGISLEEVIVPFVRIWEEH
jgi:hypothetical protein